MRRLAAVLGLLTGLVSASPAGAAVASSNWGGYAATGTHFKRISSTWVQPRVSCSGARQSFSAVWIGLGGYDSSSPALEQIGTEADCTRSGRGAYYAWYELVPSAEASIPLTIRAGDLLSASVTVSGRLVTLRLADDTRHTHFSKRVRVRALDTSSAEWIVEAPSVCDNSGACTTLRLADFGTTSFSNAAATTRGGHVGTVSDPAWSTTAIVLAQDGRAFGRGTFLGGLSFGRAVPGALTTAGDSFAVSYSSAAGQVPPLG
jgi:hypothetical protein